MMIPYNEMLISRKFINAKLLKNYLLLVLAMNEMTKQSIKIIVFIRFFHSARND